MGDGKDENCASHLPDSRCSTTAVKSLEFSVNPFFARVGRRLPSLVVGGLYRCNGEVIAGDVFAWIRRFDEIAVNSMPPKSAAGAAHSKTWRKFVAQEERNGVLGYDALPLDSIRRAA